MKALAPGWDGHRLAERIREIYRFGLSTRREREFVPLDQRRRIARLAHSLQKEIELARFAIGPEESSERAFLVILRMLSAMDGVSRLPVLGEASQSQLKRGGARRSGLQSLKASVLGKTVRLYCEAHANPRFSSEGPLVRFANTVGELALGEAKPFTSDAVKAEFRRMKLKVPRPDL
jgi:hypothetical protein